MGVGTPATPTCESLRDEVADLAARLVQVDTVNPPGNETRGATLLRDYLAAQGIAAELCGPDPDRLNLAASFVGGDGPSLAFCGHTDTVPVSDAGEWTHPPLSGHVDDQGFLWGRGAVDMKGQVAARAVAFAWLVRSGWKPAGTLRLLCQADEERGVDKVGMPWLCAERPDLRCDYAIEEGGGRALETTDGRRLVLVSVAEKAILHCRLVALGEGGHASRPVHDTNPVVRLARLIDRIARYEPRVRVLPAMRSLLDALGVDASAGRAQIVAAAEAAAPGAGRIVAPLLGITIAPTRLAASRSTNVVPPVASATLDCRLIPGLGAEELGAELERALGDDIPWRVEWLRHNIDGVTPEPQGGSLADHETPLMEAFQAAFDELDPGAVATPTLFAGFTDGHFSRSIWGTTTYGCCPYRHTTPDVYGAGVHGRDERVHVDDLAYAAAWHISVATHLLGPGGADA